jgi:hypothetical protein
MKLTSFVTLVLALIALACAPLSALAQDASTNAPSAAMPAKKHGPRFIGSITAMDATANTITIQNKKGESMTFAIAPTTKFMKDKTKAAMTDFAVGDMVTGAYTKNADGSMTATMVHKKTAAAAAPADGGAMQ